MTAALPAAVAFLAAAALARPVAYTLKYWAGVEAHRAEALAPLLTAAVALLALLATRGT